MAISERLEKHPGVEVFYDDNEIVTSVHVTSLKKSSSQGLDVRVETDPELIEALTEVFGEPVLHNGATQYLEFTWPTS